MLLLVAALACGCDGAVALQDGGADAGREAGEADASSDAGALDDAGALEDAGSDGGPSLCTSDAECAAPTPACDVASGACVACTTDAHCTDPSAPHCERERHVCGVSTLLLAALSGRTTDPVRVASYRDGAWTMADLAPPSVEGLGAFAGGGLAVTAVDRGVLLLRGNVDSGLYSAVWSGSWGALARQGTVTTGFVSPPYPAAGGAIAAHQFAMTTLSIVLARYEDGAGTWTSLDEPTGATGNNDAPPVVVVDSSGAALVIAPPPFGRSYRWTTNAGGTWTTLADVPDVPSAAPFTRNSTVAVRRAGADEIVAAFRSGGMSELRVATYSAGAWSLAVSLASDLGRSIYPLSMASVRDGRVALAYVDAASNVRLAFYDGTAWSAFITVPLPTTVGPAAEKPVALASGADASVVLELAYIDASRDLQHTRLTEESGTWSTPVTVSADLEFSYVHLAGDPLP